MVYIKHTNYRKYLNKNIIKFLHSALIYDLEILLKVQKKQNLGFRYELPI